MIQIGTGRSPRGELMSQMRTKLSNAVAATFASVARSRLYVPCGSAALLPRSGLSSTAEWDRSEPVVRRVAARRLTCGPFALSLRATRPSPATVFSRWWWF